MDGLQIEDWKHLSFPVSEEDEQPREDTQMAEEDV